jgi:hypothetical protein
LNRVVQVIFFLTLLPTKRVEGKSRVPVQMRLKRSVVKADLGYDAVEPELFFIAMQVKIPSRSVSLAQRRNLKSVLDLLGKPSLCSS